MKLTTTMNEFAENAEKIIKDPTLTFKQRWNALSKASEDSYDPVELSEEAQYFVAKGIVFDMFEGKAPYRPRYVTMDFDLFMKQGSEFLMLEPPTDIWEAVSNLLIMYHHVPSSIGPLVYMGHVDRLLAPFDKDEAETRKAVKFLLTHVDRVISDSFCHMNIGPYDTRVGRIILELTSEMKRPVPNMSFIYNENTSDEFATLAISCGLEASKPSFVNDRMYREDLGENYCVASCYNTLPIGGGGYTLGRINLKNVAVLALEKELPLEDVLHDLLPRAVKAQCEQMHKRIQYIVEDCKFFENCFLAREGLIHKDRFVGMFGMLGLADCVNLLLNRTEKSTRFGNDEEANKLGETILDIIQDVVSSYPSEYGTFRLHGQVGIAEDRGVTPGTRIPVGDEPDLATHLSVTARMQKHFSAGTGDLYPFDNTAKLNPEAILDIIKGAFAQNMRYISYYSSDSDVIRVTGYLVKKSDIIHLEHGNQVLADTTPFGMGAKQGLKILERKVNRV